VICELIVLVQMEDNSATLTPYGSLIRISPAKVSSSKSWTAKLRAVLALLFRWLRPAQYKACWAAFRVNFLVAKALSCIPTTTVCRTSCHDERTLMSDAEQREIAEAMFEPKQSREQIRDAIKLEEARRATMVKNLYRLRALRLSRNQAGSPKREG
jgi:hypothetical protein